MSNTLYQNKHYSHNEDCPVCGGSQSVGVYKDSQGNEQRYCFSTKMGECPSNKKANKPLMHQPGSLPEAKLIESIGLSDKTCQLYRITQEGEKLYFGRATPNGQLHSVLVRNYAYPKKDKSHHWKWIGQGNSGLLYGMDTVQGDEIIITEGFLDAAAAYEMTGIPAVSLPNGTGSVEKSLKECYSFLRKFRTIYVILDNDEEGVNASQKIIDVLGYRAKQVILPIHKVNLQDRIIETKDSFDFLRYRLERVYARALEASKFASSPFVYGDEADEEYEKYVNGGMQGWSTGIPELDSRVTFRPHEFTVLFGAPGRGKSSLARFFAAQMTSQKVKPYFLAFEEPPQSVISGFIPLLSLDTKLLDTKLSAKEQAKRVREQVILGKIEDKITPELLHECLECAIVSYGCKYLVIDHITWLIDKSREPVMAARQYLHVIAEVAKAYPVHILCISHNKPTDTNFAPKLAKGKSLSSDWEEYLEPTLRDAQWSSGFEQLAWVILGWKNPDSMKEPGRLYILKDRVGGMSQLGTPVRLYFNDKTKAYYGVSSQYNGQVSKRKQGSFAPGREGDTLRGEVGRDSIEELLPVDREEHKSIHTLYQDSTSPSEDEHLPREFGLARQEGDNRSPPDRGVEKISHIDEDNDMEPRLLCTPDGVINRDEGQYGARLHIQDRGFKTSASQLVQALEDSLSRFKQEDNDKKAECPILPVGRRVEHSLVSFQSPQQTQTREHTLDLVQQLWGKNKRT